MKTNGKMILFLALAGNWFSTASNAWARLGESEAQLTGRYGSPIQTATNGALRSLTFNFGDYFVLAKLREGKSVAEFAYLKKKGVDFNETDALAIASKMAGATNWTEKSAGGWEKDWVIKSPALYASLSNEPGRAHSIMVTTMEELKREDTSPSPSKAGNGF